MDEIKISDVRCLNSKDRTDPKHEEIPLGTELTADFSVFNWPLYRDWTSEARYLHSVIMKHKLHFLSNESYFAL